MAKRRLLATLFTYLALELGVALGLPLRPEQIEELTRVLNQTQVVCVVKDEESGEPPR